MHRTLFALVAALGLLLAFPAVAQAATEHYPDDDWQVRQYNEGWESEGVFSSVVDGSAVVLNKTSGPVGTSIETDNLGLDVTQGQTMTVDYSLDGDASTAAGAIRMFFYLEPDADTGPDGEGPTVEAVAEADEGVLEIEVPQNGTIGTMGLTYDASNNSAGSVRFDDLMVGDTAIPFFQPKPTPTPTVTVTAEPEPQPTATETVTATATPTVTSDGKLPETGMGSAAGLVGLGAALVVFGVGVMAYRARRR